MDETKPIKTKTLTKQKSTNFKDIESVDDVNDDKLRNKKSVKRFLIRFFILHLGIYCITAAYIISGAFLFQLLEKQNFIENCQTAQGKTNNLIKNYRSSLFNYIYFNTTTSYLTNINSTYSLDTPNKYGPLIKKMLMDFRDEVLVIYSSYKYYGQDCFKENLWSFESAFLLAITIVSTLGYGHVTPITWQGQIVCICYATVGIPIFLMSINNLSTVLSNIFVNLYSSIVFCQCETTTEPNDDENFETKHDEKNELKPDKNSTIGLIKSTDNLIVNDENDDEEDDEPVKINVPLVIILLVMGGYTALGAYCFTLIEKWTMVQAIYYSFISVSTIGLGDYVPGIQDLSSGKEKNAAGNLLIATAFIFIGIAILGMCFKLIQDTITNKSHILTNMLGISSENINKLDTSNQDNGNDDQEKELDNIEIKHKMIRNSNEDILFVKSSKKILSSNLINDESYVLNQVPVPVIPDQTITKDTEKKMFKFIQDGHLNNKSKIFENVKEATEIRIRNQVKPIEFN